MKEDFKNYVQKYSNIWKEDVQSTTRTYRAPYISIFQSSGYGKSRLLKEIAQEYYTFYISFASSDSTAFPRRSPIANSILAKIADIASEDSRTDYCEYFFLSCLEQLANHFEEQTPQQFFDSLDKHFEDIRTLADKKFSERVKVRDLIEQSQPLKKRSQGNWPALILFAFDESRALLQTIGSEKSPFRLIRAALASIGKVYEIIIKGSSYTNIYFRFTEIFGIFADTTSKISNFAPPQKKDPSWRKEDNQVLDLMPPFINLFTMDVMVDETLLKKLYESLPHIDTSVLFRMGRFY